jgi:hypothetical protein
MPVDVGVELLEEGARPGGVARGGRRIVPPGVARRPRREEEVGRGRRELRHGVGPFRAGLDGVGGGRADDNAVDVDVVVVVVLAIVVVHDQYGSHARQDQILERLGPARRRPDEDDEGVAEGALSGRSPEPELAVVLVVGCHDDFLRLRAFVRSRWMEDRTLGGGASSRAGTLAFFSQKALKSRDL